VAEGEGRGKAEDETAVVFICIVEPVTLPRVFRVFAEAGLVFVVLIVIGEVTIEVTMLVDS